MPAVSVIIPTYNSAQFLGQAIQSVLDQSFKDFELLVVDDGSTDNTHQVVQSIVDARIRYLQQANAGVSGARNTGIAASHGAYIVFLDADDLLRSQALQVMVRALELDSCGQLVAGGYLEVDKENRPLRVVRPWQRNQDLSFENWLTSCPFIIGAIMVRRECLDRVGGFDTSLERCEDWDLWLHLARSGCRMMWVEELIVRYRVYPGTRAGDGRLMRDGALAVLNKVLAADELAPRLKTQACAQAYLGGAFREYGSGLWAEARVDLQQAIDLAPDLAAKQCIPVADWLLGWTINPVVQDPVDYLNGVFAHLPAKAASMLPLMPKLALKALVYRACQRYAVGNVKAGQAELARLPAVDDHLAQNPSSVLQYLVDGAREQPTGQQDRLLKDIFAHLPAELAGWRSWRPKALSWLYMMLAFDAHYGGDPKGARYYSLLSIRTDPTKLGNRGLLSVAARSFMSWN